MSSRRAGLWTPQTLSEAGCVLSSKQGDIGENEGVPVGKKDKAEVDISTVLIGFFR
jgi:hypothetical protein